MSPIVALPFPEAFLYWYMSFFSDLTSSEARYLSLSSFAKSRAFDSLSMLDRIEGSSFEIDMASSSRALRLFLVSLIAPDRPLYSSIPAFVKPVGGITALRLASIVLLCSTIASCDFFILLTPRSRVLYSFSMAFSSAFAAESRPDTRPYSSSLLVFS